MKRKIFLLLLVLSTLLPVAFVSCNTESVVGPVIGYTPAQPTANIPYYGDTCELKIKANGDWTIREGGITNATTTVSSGLAGETDLAIIIESNPDAHERHISVRFTLLTGDSTQGFIDWKAIQDVAPAPPQN